MQELSVVGIGVESKTGKPLVLLKEPLMNKVLIVWVGTAEANAIARALQEMELPRPMTHDLMLNVIEDLDYHVTEVEICDTANGDYMGSITLVDQFAASRDPSEPPTRKIEARASDAIALAVRAKAPIYASEELISENAVPIELDGQQEDGGNEEDDEKFKEFIKDLKASDFSMPKDE